MTRGQHVGDSFVVRFRMIRFLQQQKDSALEAGVGLPPRDAVRTGVCVCNWWEVHLAIHWGMHDVASCLSHMHCRTKPSSVPASVSNLWVEARVLR